MSVGAIIVGAGAGTRAGFDKVFAPLAGRPVIAHSLAAICGAAAVDRVILVVAAANLDRGEALARSQDWGKALVVCQGGTRRQDSVAAGLAALGPCDWVLVHDAARPLVTAELVERGLAAVRQTGAAIPAVPVSDTIKVVGADHVVKGTPDRRTLFAVQTPQVFARELLATAYHEAVGHFTDDAGLLEQRGHDVVVYDGAPDNIKITFPGDLALAEFLLERRQCHA